ncbi:MAG: nicotinamide riboside transporter PnuC [Christensenella sp.]|nr:nicotinamide riboside transporter PnuC [Christensenella sp.]
MRNPFANLTKFEWILWVCSVILVVLSFGMGKSFHMLTLAASLVGVTALIFVAKGDVWGQALTLVFSLLYALISLEFRYYGEMITYLGMTAPIAALSIVSWLRHPYQKGKSEVKVARLTKGKIVRLAVLTVAITTLFYFVLKAMDTANLFFSTVSIATSFLASYLMFCRSSAYALAYAANDVVLIILWVLAAMENPAYLPMVVCFAVFFCNDIYGFLNWRKMRRRQDGKEEEIYV